MTADITLQLREAQAEAARLREVVANVRRLSELFLDSISIERRGMAEDVLSLLPDQPCERCVFIPTPDGKCICREVTHVDGN